MKIRIVIAMIVLIVLRPIVKSIHRSVKQSARRRIEIRRTFRNYSLGRSALLYLDVLRMLKWPADAILTEIQAMDKAGKLPDNLVIPQRENDLGSFYAAIQVYDPPTIPTQGNA